MKTSKILKNWNQTKGALPQQRPARPKAESQSGSWPNPAHGNNQSVRPSRGAEQQRKLDPRATIFLARPPIALLTAGALALFLAGPVQALDLTNRAGGAHNLQITEGDEEAAPRDIVIAAGETLYGLCRQGCLIALENGSQESFGSEETIYIEDGDLVTGK